MFTPSRACPFGGQGIEPGSALWKVHDLPAVLAFWSLSLSLDHMLPGKPYLDELNKILPENQNVISSPK